MSPTVRVRKRVLILVDNVTAMTRLLDVVDAFDGDFRIRLEYAWNSADPTPDGLDPMFAERGIHPVSPQEGEFDLVITAGHSGLDAVEGPILSVSHGIRYTKVLSEPGTRNPEPGTRNPRGAAFGLQPELVLSGGRPAAASITLSHDEQLDRLRESAPPAAEVASVIGDPCYDRLRASRPWRARYRRALGAGDRTVIAISSTWRESSLFGDAAELYGRMLAELPADEFLLVAILHPHIPYQDGPHNVHRWLAPHRRAGLVVVPPERGWRAALIAADQLVGDHGSVTTYGAGIGLPTSLAAFPRDAVAAGSAVALLGELAPRLDPDQPIAPQLRKAVAEHTADVATAIHEAITSRPDEGAGLLRSRCYSMLDLDEPRTEAVVPPDDITGLTPQTGPTAVHAGGVVRSDSISVQRYPAEMLSPERIPAGSHLVVAADHPGPRLRAVADVLVLRDAADWGEDAETWMREAFSAHPGLQLAAAVDETCTVATREGERIRISGPHDPALYASVVYVWLAAGHALAELGDGLTVNGRRVTVR